MVNEDDARGRFFAGEAHAYPRRNCGDHRNHARNREPVVSRIQEKATAAVERVDAADSKSTCFGKNCAVLSRVGTAQNCLNHPLPAPLVLTANDFPLYCMV